MNKIDKKQQAEMTDQFKLLPNSLHHNTIDVFTNNFDRTWADGEWYRDLKIGDRILDEIPPERSQPINFKNEGNVQYEYNNEWFRCDDFTKTHDGLHILFAGCSETEGVGGNLNEAWPSLFLDKIKENNKVSGFYNLGKAGWGWQKIINNFIIYTEKYGFPDYFFCFLPNVGRGFYWVDNSETKLENNALHKERKGHWRYEQRFTELDVFRMNSVGIEQPHNYKPLNKEDYFKQIIDFVQGWKLLEKYCESNGTKIICSTWDTLDQDNFETMKLEKIINYFKISYDEPFDSLNNLPLLQMEKMKTNKRDGHRGLIYHILWSNAFLKECQKRGWLNVSNI
jgi:hypothetical protein